MIVVTILVELFVIVIVVLIDHVVIAWDRCHRRRVRHALSR